MHFNDGVHRNDYINFDANLTALFKKRLLDQETQDQYLANGDPNIQIAEYILDAAGSELGFFAVAILACVFMLLNQVDGKIFRLKIFLMNRDFNIAQNEGFVKFVNFILNMLSWLSLLMPFLAIAVWASGLIIRAKDFDEVPIGGICVLLVSMSLFFFVFGVFKIKWNNFQFKIINGVCIGLAFSLFTAYQFVAIFLDETSNSYFGFSSVFLNANCCIIVLVIFLNSAIKGGSIEDLLMNKLTDGVPKQEDRDDDFMEEVQEQRADKTFFPTKADVLDLFTIAEGLQKDDLGSAFGGGLQSRFANMNIRGRRFLSVFLWFFATAILIVYSYIIHWYMDRSRLGFVTMIAVLITDVFVYLIWQSEITKSPTILCLSAMLNRLLLYCFGGNYWIYGYMVLYLIYGVILSQVITKKRFPFEDAYNDMNIDKIHDNKNQVDVSRAPEFLLLFITLVYVILFIVLYVTEPRGVPLLRLAIDNWEYPYYVNGVFCLLIIATFFALLGTYRLFIRKQRRIEPKIHYFFKNRKYDMYWIFISGSFVLLAAVGLIAYWITNIVSYFLVIIFASVFVIFYLNAFLHYVMNDYEILQNITQFNLKIDKHNERLGLLKEKVNTIKKDLMEGKASGIGEASVGLAKNIIEQDKLKKKQDKEKKNIEKSGVQKQDTNFFGVSGNAQASRLTLQKGESAYGSQIKSQVVQKSPSNYTSVKVNETQANVQLKVQPIAIGKVKPQDMNTTKNNGTITPNQHEDDLLINEEIARNNTKVEKDDIYEGGEEEDGVNENYRIGNDDNELEGKEEDDDSTDEEVDFEAEEDDSDQKKQKKKLKSIIDWRVEYNVVQAFFLGKLRHNDYQIIWSLLVAHIALILLAVLVSVDQNDVTGVNIAVPLVHYTMAGFSLSKHLNTDAKLTVTQYFFFFLSYCIQYGWAIANLFISYSSEDIDPSTPGAAGAGTYMVVYLMVIPFITSAASAAAKWYDDKGKFTFFLFIQLLLTFLQGIGMLVLAYVYMTYIQGIIISVIVVVIGYVILQVYIYVKHDFYMPTLWTIINLLIILAVIVSATVVSLFFDEFRTFTGVSISCWVTAALFIVYGLAEIGSDLAKMETKPIFFSPWIFPIYIYNPKKNDVESHNLPTVALIAGLIILMVWAVLCSVWVYPHNVGISLSILFELILIIVCFHLIGVSAHQLRDCTMDIDKKLIRRAWLDAKLGYINNRSAINREQLVTYKKIKFRRDVMRNFMRMNENRAQLNLEERDEDVAFIEDNIVRDSITDCVDETKVNLGSIPSCYSYLFLLEKEQNRIYREELELIIQFQLLIVQQAENLQEQKKKYLFTFLNEKKAALFALGIVINIPDQGNMSIRYARVITQIQKLTPEKQTMFNHLRDHFIQEQREVDEKRREAALIEEEKEKERQEMMGQLSEEKRKLLASVTMDMPVDKMPDCEMKWDKIKLEAANGKIYEDTQFKAGDTILGPNCLNRGVSRWVRARDKPNCVLFKDKINHLDVVQGALGDCYLLSAISVLGEKYVKKIIVSTEEEWRTTGAICVQFFKEGEPEIIIIDDLFPAYANGDWVFVKGGAEGDELWPMVLEKAYAKMYGTFNYIEAGKVQYALADMTDGFPEQIDLKIDGKNIQKLWENLKTLKRTGCLMGAGSPEHSMGDRAINEMGIVQGHAYAVLDVVEVDGHKLMQLRNPHGSSGEEWKGDWSDTCEKWDQRMRNKVGYQDSSADGVFWMEVLDFVQQYSYLYICRILDNDDGWKEIRVEGSWKGASAEGLPSRKNPNARIDYNPQYAITVTKPCDGFISLLQKDKVNMFKGKHSIFFMVSKTNGKRITKVDKQTLVAKSGNPVNLNIVTAECDFDKSVSYPYKFTIMISNTEHGEEGQGDFEFAVYSTDQNFKIEELPPAKDFPQGGKHNKDIE